MEFVKTSLEDAVLVCPKVFGDARGFFFESYSKREFAANGIDCEFVQDNHSRSSRGVLRGLHYQLPPYAQAKLVRCARGAIHDIIVDIRRGSPTFGKWEGFDLTEENRRMLYVPRGFAHGFFTVSDIAEVLYKADNFYTPPSESGIAWNDPVLGVRWPEGEPRLSAKDAALGVFDPACTPFSFRA